MKTRYPKYRAWHIRSKRMLDVISLGITRAFSILSDDGVTYFEEYNDKFIPLESTGLKDKNGKEIFEGDIISLDWDGDGWYGGEVKYSEDEGKFYIEYDSFEDWYAVKDWEVLGNKFENPQLLKDE